MNYSNIDEPMLEAYVYETSQIVENLEQLVIRSEKDGVFSEESINEIFRYMHTIKGSSAMMMFNSVSILAHRVEDVFFLIREHEDVQYDFAKLVDIILDSIDYFKLELIKITNREDANGDNSLLIEEVDTLLNFMKEKNELPTDDEKKEAKVEKQKYYISSSPKEEVQAYKAKVIFQENCEMENIRAYTIIHNIVNLVEEVFYEPSDVIDNDDSIEVIQKNGFNIIMQSKEDENILEEYLKETVLMKSLEFCAIKEDEYKTLVNQYNQKEVDEEIKIPKTSKKYKETKKEKQDSVSHSKGSSIISVNLERLDRLMDMVGELVIAEAMVTQNPEILRLEIESFDKASRQLHKISSDLQDMVMAIRMVPLSTTFMKMHRIVRDMTRKLNKNVVLDVFGEETEVDKNIIEKISDPLMHIIRNSIDHGIEDEDTRLSKGKEAQGTVSLEAKNSGSDVLIIIKDDGKGLNKRAFYDKAKKQEIVHREFEDMSDRELYNLILAPGFSTKEQVTEFSGRGVGMDVVAKNIESVGGTVIVDSALDVGTTIILKIPLTLAIIEGMNIKVGQSRFTLPIVAIKESFRPAKDAVFKDTEGNEMIMVRGLCYPIVRLHKVYDIKTDVESFEQGILIMVEEDDRSCCIFADELIGQQQVVVKSLPDYIKRYKNIKGLAGCTLLGDGSISLILDVGDFDLSDVNLKREESR